jgi:hypothetical protein
MKDLSNMNSTKSPESSKRTGNSSLSNGGLGSATSEPLRLKSVDFKAGKLLAHFSNGSDVAVDIARYPRLQRATQAQRNKWRLIGNGTGIHWEEIDEDLSIENLLFASAKTVSS